jgi:hypothetical protein
LLIDAELLAGPAGICLYADSIQEWDDPGVTQIGSDERDEIIDNIRRAFRSRGFEIQVL